MPHLESASVQDFHSSTKLSFTELSQRYSDDVFVLSNQGKAVPGQRRNGTDHSEDLFNRGLPSPPASESDEADVLTPPTNLKHCHFVHRLPRTPSPDREIDTAIDSWSCYAPDPQFQTSSTIIPVPNHRTPSPASKHARRFDTLPFPLEPPQSCVLELGAKDSCGSIQSPKRRCVSAEGRILTPPTSPDRYISNRHSPQPRSTTFRISKSPQQLSSTERLLRQDSASPDPFGRPTRLREGRRVVSSSDSRQEARSPLRAASGTNVLGLNQSTLTVQSRQASAGAVWNVGGNTATVPTGPIQGVPNGRGGLTGSGTNAPLYTSRFLEGDTPDQDLERLEGRLAVALEIDQTTRMLDIPGFPTQARPAGTDSLASKRKYPSKNSKTTWKDGGWVQEGASLCEFALVQYLCILGIFEKVIKLLIEAWLIWFQPARTKVLREESRLVPTTPFR